MLIVDKKIFFFKCREIHFAEYPYDDKGTDVLRFQFSRNKVEAKGFKRVESLTLITDLTQDLTLLRKGIRERYRKHINQAEREGIKIKINQNYYEIQRINKNFRRAKNLISIFNIGTPSVKEMSKYCTVFSAEFNGEVLVGHLYLEDKDNIEWWVIGSKRLEVDKEKAGLIGRANRLLLWEAMKYAKEKGIKIFDWGGLWPEAEAEKSEEKKGINFFKLGFGGKIVTRYSYEKIYSKAYQFAQFIQNQAELVVRR